MLYAGTFLFAVGVLLLIPRRRRRMAAGAAVTGVLLCAIALAWPAREERIVERTTRLDQFMPVWQFNERHATHVAAPPQRVFEAAHAVRVDEILLFRTLTAIRRLGRPLPESILNAPASEPLLDIATRTSFIYLAPRELVVGTVVMAPREARASGKLTAELFGRTLRPGVALATMNFLITPDGRGGSLLSTETRVFANSDSARRGFAVYWRFIHPGSDIIRRMWLRAIKRRAERAG